MEETNRNNHVTTNPNPTGILGYESFVMGPVSNNILAFPRKERPLVKRTLTSGGYEAVFFVDSRTGIQAFHYIITKIDSPEILAWGRESTSRDAERQALDCMHDLYRRSLNQAAAG